jgi:hybrid cluster-associated redox disulfide protein
MQPSEITGATFVDDLVTRFPQTARVFVQRRMHCVGCEVSRFETLAGAARVYGNPIEPLLIDLRAAAALCAGTKTVRTFKPKT